MEFGYYQHLVHFTEKFKIYRKVLVETMTSSLLDQLYIKEFIKYTEFQMINQLKPLQRRNDRILRLLAESKHFEEDHVKVLESLEATGQWYLVYLLKAKTRNEGRL